MPSWNDIMEAAETGTKPNGGAWQCGKSSVKIVLGGAIRTASTTSMDSGMGAAYDSDCGGEEVVASEKKAAEACYEEQLNAECDYYENAPIVRFTDSETHPFHQTMMAAKSRFEDARRIVYAMRDEGRPQKDIDQFVEKNFKPFNRMEWTIFYTVQHLISTNQLLIRDNFLRGFSTGEKLADFLGYVNKTFELNDDVHFELRDVQKPAVPTQAPSTPVRQVRVIGHLRREPRSENSRELIIKDASGNHANSVSGGQKGAQREVRKPRAYKK